MNRVFPTQLLVVDNMYGLDPELEGKRGYWDDAGSNIHFGVSGDKHEIIISAPAYWYRSYRVHVPSLTADEMWAMVASVVKTECGRRVMHSDGESHITVPKVSKEHAKQMYYLLKHVLTKASVPFTMLWSLVEQTNKGDQPDIRKRREKRVKNKKKNQWASVVKKGMAEEGSGEGEGEKGGEAEAECK